MVNDSLPRFRGNAPSFLPILMPSPRLLPAMSSLFNELRRRNVVRAGIAYLITGWVLAQVLEAR